MMPFANEQLSLEGDVNLLAVLRRDPFVGMGVSGMEGVNALRGTPVAGLSLGRNYSIGILIIKYTGAIRMQKVEPPN